MNVSDEMGVGGLPRASASASVTQTFLSLNLLPESRNFKFK